jgi:hypothetical protein
MKVLVDLLREEPPPALQQLHIIGLDELTTGTLEALEGAGARGWVREVRDEEPDRLDHAGRWNYTWSRERAREEEEAAAAVGGEELGAEGAAAAAAEGRDAEQ